MRLKIMDMINKKERCVGSSMLYIILINSIHFFTVRH